MSDSKKYIVLEHEANNAAGDHTPGMGDSFTRDYIGQTLTAASAVSETGADYLFGRPTVDLFTEGGPRRVTFPLDVLAEVMPVEVGQVRVWVYKGVLNTNKYEITHVNESEAHYHYVGEEYQHTRPLSDFEESAVVGNTLKDVPEGNTVSTERGYIGGVHYTSLKVGDTIGFVSDTHFSVYRDVESEPEAPKPQPGTFGTAVVDGKRIHGLIDEDGDFTYLKYDDGYSEKEYTQRFEDFQADEDF